MRLCFIADGRSIHTQRWVEYFAMKGHEVHLITYDPMERTIPGVSEHVLTTPFKNLFLAFYPRNCAIKRIIREIRPDLIHAHFIAKYGFHLPPLKFHPSIVSAWGDDVLILPKKSRLIAYYTKKVLESVDIVYAVSQNIRNHIIEDFLISEQKVRYFPFGITTDFFTPTPENSSRFSSTVEIFSNRGFFPVYDNATLIRGFAIALAKNPALHLTLKGEGPLEMQMRDLVCALNLSGSVTFRKKTPYSEVPNDYRNADIFITTSVSDGTPVSILEAMASGLPCIATGVGGIPEWVEPKKTGILIPSSSPQAVAEALLTLAADPAIRMQMGREGRKKILQNGEWNTLMVQAEKDYLALIETYSRDKK